MDMWLMHWCLVSRRGVLWQIWVGVGTTAVNGGSEEICGNFDACYRGIVMAPPP